MKKNLKLIFLLCAILLGTYHFWLAVKAVFVFRNDEPTSLWVFTFTGPLSTLPASITGLFKPKAGGMWLICGAIVSFIAAMATAGRTLDFQSAIWFLKVYSGPMLLLGLAFLFLLGGKEK